MNRTHYLWLASILLGYFLLAIAYSIAVPLAETPDESEHFRYLQHITLTGRLPIMQPVREENATLEAHQPPLLYLTGAMLTGWMELDPADNLIDNSCFSFEPEDRGRQNAFFHRTEEWPPQRGVYQAFQVMRWFSVLLGLGTVWLAYLIGRQVVPGDGRFGLLTAAMLAFNPQWIHITASFNNDVPSTFFGAAIIYVSIRAAVQPQRRLFVLGGVLLGLGFLSKMALLAFWPLPFLAALWPYLPINLSKTDQAIRPHNRSLVSNLLLVFLLPLIIAGWWYWRGYHLHGDPLMWDVTLAAKGAVIARNTPFTLADLGEFLVTHFQSYWLWFGWLNVKAPPWVYWLVLLVVIAAAVGLIRLLVKRHLVVNRLAILFCMIGILTVYASLLLYIQTINWTGYQGRLAFTAAAPIAVLLALGLYSLNRKILGQIVTSGLFLLSTMAIPFIILPAYPRPEIYEPSPDLTRTCIRFAGGLQVEAADIPPTTKPGKTLPVTLYGLGLDSSPSPQVIVARLLGWEGELLGEASGNLSWEAGEVISTTLAIPINETPPVKAVMQVAMLAADGSWQTATSATGRVLDIPLGIETVKIAPSRPFLPLPMYDVSAQFGDSLKLIGYDIDSANGQVTLYWQTLAPMTTDFTTFVHVLDDAGNIVTQADSQPQNGRYPTSVWDLGEIVADDKQLVLPAERSYELAVGVYRLDTLERLPAFTTEETRLPNDQLILPADRQ